MPWSIGSAGEYSPARRDLKLADDAPHINIA
jgi:hypothetical protein